MALRGGFVETAHPIRVVAIQHDEAHHTHTAGVSGAAAHSPWRSAGKHLQAHTALSLLPDQGASLTDEALAIAVSSHSGQDRHLALVRGLLERYGLDEGALQCGAEAPIHRPTRDALMRQGLRPAPIHNDCSGKHALMLAACVSQGWSLDYLGRDHPLQRAVAAQVAAWVGESPGLAVDGCGVPTFYISVTGMARAWARMATVTQDGHLCGVGDPLMQRIGVAAAAHPWLTSGDGRLDLALSERVREPYFGKIGAGGIFCVALPQRRMGIALKVASGNEDALAVATVEALRRLAPGSVAPSPGWRWAEVNNVAGQKVGWRVATWQIRV